MGLGEPFILCHAPPRVSTSSDWELPLHLGVAVRIKPTHKCKLTNNSCHVLCEPLLPSTLPISNVPRFFRPDDSAVPSAAGAWPWPPVALAADGAQGQGTLQLRAPQVPKDSGPGQPGAAPNTPQRPRPTHQGCSCLQLSAAPVWLTFGAPASRGANPQQGPGMGGEPTPLTLRTGRRSDVS